MLILNLLLVEVLFDKQSDYYPYGGVWAQSDMPTASTRYTFSGKEVQSAGSSVIPYLDFGARQLDTKGLIWTTVDPLAEDDPSVNLYAYCRNNPINGIDLDGNLVVFINGFNVGESASDYPRPGGKYTGNNWIGTRKYWQNSANFDYAVMHQMNDYNAIYRDGLTGGDNSLGVSIRQAQNRFKNGYEQGAFDAARLVNALARDQQGNIKETIKIITHSMGAAYAKGYVTALLGYIVRMGFDKSIIAFEADFAPYQPQDQRAVDGVTTLQFSHSDDSWAGNREMPEAIQMDTSNDIDQGHKLRAFRDQVNQLPQGIYKVKNGQIIQN